jgi:uncharacterized protein involved in outer membrane biogenesis
MRTSLQVPGWLTSTLRILVAVGIILAALVTGLMTFSPFLRSPLISYAERHYRRPIQVAGKFEVHLLSLHPRLVAEQVSIGNPAWTATGITAQIGHLSITYDLPWPGRSWGFRRLEMGQTTLNLLRDEDGRANWQAHDPDAGLGKGPPLIRSLSMPGAHVHLEDRRRQLEFDGTVTAQEVPGPDPAKELRIDGLGRLNGRDVSFRLDGDPLATVAHERPYRFEFAEHSSGSEVSVHGSVPHPFDLRVLVAAFTAAGEDLKDLYFLTGLRLVDTGPYRLSGRYARNGTSYQFTDLKATSGHSDMSGTISIETHRPAPPHVQMSLQSELLRLSDLGPRAAGRAPPASGEERLLPDTPFRLTRMRRRDTIVQFHARVLEAGHLALRAVAAQVKIDAGVISVTPLSAHVGEQGRITGQLKMDVRPEVPEATVHLQIANLPLDQLGARPSLIDGPLQARVTLTGRGNSLHALASKANGRLTVVLPAGTLRASAAELVGFDLRAPALKMTGDEAETDIRCGVAGFEVKDGLMTAERLLMDTDPMLITGHGNIDLESEALDLRLQGHPKRPRLRLRAPLLVQGPLRHPGVKMDAKKPAAQAAGAVVLGTLLTPVAAMLAFVDPGLTKDANCAALLAEADSPSR